MTKDKTVTMSRELIEHLAAYASDSASAVMRARSVETRKILAKSADEEKVNNRQMGLMQFVDKHAAPIVEADGMGEAIYQIQYLGDGGGGWSDVELDRYEQAKSDRRWYRTQIVYASPPAPAYTGGLNQASIGTCDVPPPGWVCSRGKGHEGPCAASQAPVQQKKENFTYSSNQATNCAGCSNHKHTPLRVDAMGGYVCLTCIYNELDRLLIEESARNAEPDWEGCQEISELPHVHEAMKAFSHNPSDDNAIAVVQTIVLMTTRPVTE